LPDVLNHAEFSAKDVDVKICYGAPNLSTKAPAGSVMLDYTTAVGGIAELAGLFRTVAVKASAAVHQCLVSSGAFSESTAGRIAFDCMQRCGAIMKILSISSIQEVAAMLNAMMWVNSPSTGAQFGRCHSLLAAVEMALSVCAKSKPPKSIMWLDAPGARLSHRELRDKHARERIALEIATASAPLPVKTVPVPTSGKSSSATPSTNRKSEEAASPPSPPSPSRGKLKESPVSKASPQADSGKRFSSVASITGAVMQSSVAAYTDCTSSASALAAGFAMMHGDVHGPRKWASL
jgi:hypothetical protein